MPTALPPNPARVTAALPRRALGLLLLCASRCADPPLPRLPAADAAYRLAPGDQIRLLTFEDDQLSGEFRVDPSGQIALPLLGPLPAAGRTAAGFADDVAAALRERRLLKTPKVSAEVTLFRPVYVLGEVTRPGQYPYQPGLTVLGAVALAGGFTYRAVKDRGVIARAGAEGSATRQDPVLPGDVVTILERDF